MADLIDRQAAIDTAIEAADKWDGGYSSEREGIIRKFFDKVPAVQPDHVADIGKKVADEDCISRQMAIEAMGRAMWAKERLEELPSAQLDGIPLEWIDKHLEWLDNCDNDFAQLAKVSIKAMVELWKKDRI